MRRLAEFPMQPRQSVRQSQPANPEQMRVCAHAHGIKSINRKYFFLLYNADLTAD